MMLTSTGGRRDDKGVGVLPRHSLLLSSLNTISGEGYNSQTRGTLLSSQKLSGPPPHHCQPHSPTLFLHSGLLARCGSTASGLGLVDPTLCPGTTLFTTTTTTTTAAAATTTNATHRRSRRVLYKPSSPTTPTPPSSSCFPSPQRVTWNATTSAAPGANSGKTPG